jgi:hypothetical protein
MSSAGNSTIQILPTSGSSQFDPIVHIFNGTPDSTKGYNVINVLISAAFPVYVRVLQSIFNGGPWDDIEYFNYPKGSTSGQGMLITVTVRAEWFYVSVENRAIVNNNIRLQTIKQNSELVGSVVGVTGIVNITNFPSFFGITGVAGITGFVTTAGRDETLKTNTIYVDTTGAQRTTIVPARKDNAKYIYEIDLDQIIEPLPVDGWSLDPRGRDGWYFSGNAQSSLTWFGNANQIPFNMLKSVYFVATMGNTTVLPKIQITTYYINTNTLAYTWEYNIDTVVNIYNGETYLFYCGNNALNLHTSYRHVPMNSNRVIGPGNEYVHDIKVIAPAYSQFLLERAGICDPSGNYETVFDTNKDIMVRDKLLNLDFCGSYLNTLVSGTDGVNIYPIYTDASGVLLTKLSSTDLVGVTGDFNLTFPANTYIGITGMVGVSGAYNGLVGVTGEVSVKVPANTYIGITGMVGVSGAYNGLVGVTGSSEITVPANTFIGITGMVGVSGFYKGLVGVTGSSVITVPANTFIGITGMVGVSGFYRGLVGVTGSSQITVPANTFIGITGMVGVSGMYRGLVGVTGSSAITVPANTFIGITGMVGVSGMYNGLVGVTGSSSITVPANTFIGITGMVGVSGAYNGLVGVTGSSQITVPANTFIGITGMVGVSGAYNGLVGVTGSSAITVPANTFIGITGMVGVSGAYNGLVGVTGSSAITVPANTFIGITGMVGVSGAYNGLVGVTGSSAITVPANTVIGITGMVGVSGFYNGLVGVTGSSAITVPANTFIGITGMVGVSGMYNGLVGVTGSSAITVPANTYIGITGVVNVVGTDGISTNKIYTDVCGVQRTEIIETYKSTPYKLLLEKDAQSRIIVGSYTDWKLDPNGRDGWYNDYNNREYFITFYSNTHGTKPLVSEVDVWMLVLCNFSNYLNVTLPYLKIDDGFIETNYTTNVTQIYSGVPYLLYYGNKPHKLHPTYKSIQLTRSAISTFSIESLYIIKPTTTEGSVLIISAGFWDNVTQQEYAVNFSSNMPQINNNYTWTSLTGNNYVGITGMVGVSGAYNGLVGVTGSSAITVPSNTVIGITGLVGISGMYNGLVGVTGEVSVKVPANTSIGITGMVGVSGIVGVTGFVNAYITNNIGITGSAYSTLTTIETDISSGVLMKGDDGTGLRTSMYTDVFGVQRTQIVPLQVDTAKYIFSTDCSLITTPSLTGWSIDARGRQGWYYTGGGSQLKWYGNQIFTNLSIIQFIQIQSLWMVVSCDSVNSIPYLLVDTSGGTTLGGSTWKYSAPNLVYAGETNIYYYGSKALTLNPGISSRLMTRSLLPGGSNGAPNEPITSISISGGATNYLVSSAGIWDGLLQKQFKVTFDNNNDYTQQQKLMQLSFDVSSNLKSTITVPANTSIGITGMVGVSGMYNGLVGITGFINTNITNNIGITGSAYSTLTTIETDISSGVLMKGDDGTGLRTSVYTDEFGVQRTQTVPVHVDTAKYIFSTDCSLITTPSLTGWSLDARGRQGWYYTGGGSQLKWYRNQIFPNPFIAVEDIDCIWMVVSCDSLNFVLPELRVITTGSTIDYSPKYPSSIFSGETYLYYYGEKALSLNPGISPRLLTRTVSSGSGAGTITSISISGGTNFLVSSAGIASSTGIFDLGQFKVTFDNNNDYTQQQKLMQLSFDVSSNLKSTITGQLTSEGNYEYVSATLARQRLYAGGIPTRYALATDSLIKGESIVDGTPMLEGILPGMYNVTAEITSTNVKGIPGQNRVGLTTLVDNPATYPANTYDICMNVNGVLFTGLNSAGNRNPIRVDSSMGVINNKVNTNCINTNSAVYALDSSAGTCDTVTYTLVNESLSTGGTRAHRSLDTYINNASTTVDRTIFGATGATAGINTNTGINTYSIPIKQKQLVMSGSTGTSNGVLAGANSTFTIASTDWGITKPKTFSIFMTTGSVIKTFFYDYVDTNGNERTGTLTPTTVNAWHQLPLQTGFTEQMVGINSVRVSASLLADDVYYIAYNASIATAVASGTFSRTFCGIITIPNNAIGYVSNFTVFNGIASNFNLHKCDAITGARKNIYYYNTPFSTNHAPAGFEGALGGILRPGEAVFSANENANTMVMFANVVIKYLS